MKTKVIFRAFPDGEVFALFPEIPATVNPCAHCLSYMHTGQHGAASVTLAMVTRPATQSEIAPLVAELAAIGYDLKPVKRFTAAHCRARVAALASVERGDA